MSELLLPTLVIGSDPLAGSVTAHPGDRSGDEVAHPAHDMGAGFAPCRYGMLKFNLQSSALLVKLCDRLGQTYRNSHCGTRPAIPVAKA
jgi:hypothetical protein